MKKDIIKKITDNKLIAGITITLFTLLVLYLCISIYFTKHFYFGTEINGINASCKTVEEVEQALSHGADSYSLELVGRDNVNSKITASDINLKYNPNGKIEGLKDSQNPFGWISSIFKKYTYEAPGVISYNKEKLEEYFNSLPYFDKDTLVKPKNASFKYTTSGYEIVPEVYGNKVKASVLYNDVVNSIVNRETTLNLDSSNCYENPTYTSKSEEVIDAKKQLDKYVSAKITYTIGDYTDIVDGSLIHNWLNVSKNMKVSIDDTKVQNFVVSLANKYNTAGKTRDFKSSTGKNVKVSGGSYGWKINVSEETSALESLIKNGETTTKAPIYAQKAKVHGISDIGDTFVEIDFSKQHLWFYKDGALVAQGDVVTGNESNKTGTPPGVYSLNYKEKNATLKGENYSTPVDFWMPFNGGIGMHDAKWRDKFGGEIYKTSGSHGCINCPPELAKTIFENIEPGTPIVCYFE
ncbi:MAG: peptidoglycan binding domain-containing protein [Clostridium sp.]|uniref:L,D-transpeptidase family protein n=1 Tax=Clostridium sp. TaxID=1506 RepID=UPI003F3F5E41